MAKNYYVIDGEGNTVWQGREKDDGPQSFATFVAAEKRAKEYADSQPGTEIRIVKVEAVVLAAVTPPKTRKI